MLVDRGGRNQILLAELRFDQPAFQVAFGAVTLDAARRARQSGL
jgi:hypothetical protein